MPKDRYIPGVCEYAPDLVFDVMTSISEAEYLELELRGAYSDTWLGLQRQREAAQAQLDAAQAQLDAVTTPADADPPAPPDAQAAELVAQIKDLSDQIEAEQTALQDRYGALLARCYHYRAYQLDDVTLDFTSAAAALATMADKRVPLLVQAWLAGAPQAAVTHELEQLRGDGLKKSFRPRT